MANTIPVIIVSHNSGDVLPLCLRSLAAQEDCIPEVTVVDSGSADTVYLKDLQRVFGFTLIERPNIGFSRANNTGYSSLENSGKAVVFCNPDTLLPRDYLKRCLTLLRDHEDVGIFTGPLHGFDPESEQPTGLLDSTGVFRKWYGRWYDRDQGNQAQAVLRTAEHLPAACGALLFCRREAVDSLGTAVFDPDFFLYKEDIEFSLRMRKKGWLILFQPDLKAYHCRGWNRNRKKVPQEVRETAAWSEVLLYRKHPSMYMIWALAKLAAVRWFGM